MLAAVLDERDREMQVRFGAGEPLRERQRDEFVATFESRLREAENELRRRLGELAADAEAERAVLEARLQELIRRLDDTAGVRTGAG